jgi:hypothetical protein
MVQMTVPWAARAKLNGEPASFSFILSESLKKKVNGEAESPLSAVRVHVRVSSLQP